MWWYPPIIPALWRLRQEDNEFEASLDYMGISCLKRKPKRKKECRSKRLHCSFYALKVSVEHEALLLFI
jgi:hypothetical protein